MTIEHDTMLELDRVVKAYRGVRAVDDVSMQVRKGEIYGFLGPNGAGKSTSLRMLLGLARPDAGRAAIRGFDPLESPREAHDNLGYLPETLSLYRTLTGRQTLRFFADVKGVRAESIDEVLHFVGMEQAAGKRVGEYSRGMVQRIGLAQALLGDPDVLVLDEPTGGLDPIAQRQVKDMLRERNRKGTTVLFSSHILSEVQELAHRVGMMRKGKLVAQDTVARLRDLAGLRGALRLTLARPSPEIAVAIQRMPGVESARLDGEQLVVVCDASLRFDVAKQCEALGSAVLNMETTEATLEDVFMKLAQGGDVQ